MTPAAYDAPIITRREAVDSFTGRHRAGRPAATWAADYQPRRNSPRSRFCEPRGFSFSLSKSDPLRRIIGTILRAGATFPIKYVDLHLSGQSRLQVSAAEYDCLKLFHARLRARGLARRVL
jgi:hypothetical protein